MSASVEPTAAADTRERGSRFEWLLGHEWIVLAYVVSALALFPLLGLQLDLGLALDFTYDFLFLDGMALVLIALLFASGLRARRTESDRTPFGPAWRARIRREFLTRQRAWDFARALLLLKLVLVVYCNLKQAIPRLNARVFDEQLLRADVALHLGWNLDAGLPQLLGQAWIARCVDTLYAAWFLVKAPTIVVFLLVRDRRLQARFFGAYFALWIVGGLCAVLAPSVGPIYVHPEWYEGVAKPIASDLQRELWTHYQQALANPDEYRAFVYEGVAAFPSLHVAVVALFAFFLFRVDRRLGWAMLAYTVVIQLGSVLLGWHYAVDGYFGIALAYVLGKTSEHWTRFAPKPRVRAAG